MGGGGGGGGVMEWEGESVMVMNRYSDDVLFSLYVCSVCHAMCSLHTAYVYAVCLSGGGEEAGRGQ